ncbi:MAG: 30S ribosomal protein S6 [Mariprofundaceae bacterium]
MYYETIFIVNPDISRENAEKITDDLVAKVEKAGGRIVKRENWGSRPLAYAINKRKRGHYILLVTDGGAEVIGALQRGIALEERIMRSLTVRLDELTDEPSPLARRKVKRAETAADDAEAAADAGAEAAGEGAEAETGAA